MNAARFAASMPLSSFGAAPIQIAVLDDAAKRVHRPLAAVHAHHIHVRDEQERLGRIGDRAAPQPRTSALRPGATSRISGVMPSLGQNAGEVLRGGPVSLPGGLVVLIFDQLNEPNPAPRGASPEVSPTSGGGEGMPKGGGPLFDLRAKERCHGPRAGLTRTRMHKADPLPTHEKHPQFESVRQQVKNILTCGTHGSGRGIAGRCLSCTMDGRKGKNDARRIRAHLKRDGQGCGMMSWNSKIGRIAAIITTMLLLGTGLAAQAPEGPQNASPPRQTQRPRQSRLRPSKSRRKAA